jgi:hypothetical protein
MNTLIKSAVAALFLASAVHAQAHDYTLGGINVTHPKAFETAKNANVGGGYMTIENTTGAADKLLEVRVDAIPRVELHLSETDANGVARMIKQDGIEIPAGETVTLQPGGLHVMFMELGGDGFVLDEKINATLVFETAGELEIDFNIEARSAGDHGSMDHGKMDHGTMKKSD